MIDLVNITAYGSELTLHHGEGKRTIVRGTYDLYTKETNGFKQHKFPSSWKRRDFEAELRAKGITPYEADVSPTRRWLTENQANVRILKPQAAYLDFEADSRATIKEQISGRARVLCWSLLAKDGSKLQTGLLPEDNDPDEAKMLHNLWQAIRPHDQILAWHGGMVEWDILKTDEAKHGYDFYVLLRRSNNLGVLPKGWERVLWCDHLSVFKKNNLNSGERSEKISYSLQSIGMAKTGHGKTGFDSKHTWEEWVAGGSRRQALMDYNIGDVQLEREIELATDYLSVFQSACEVTLNFPDTVALQPSRQVDALLLAYGARRGIRFPTKPRNVGEQKDKAFSGAFVDGPYVHGIETDIHVADFKALYPSIIISLNISPETLGGKGSTAPIDQESLDKFGVTEPVTFSTDTIGVLPECLIDMMRLRDEWKVKAKQFPVGSPEEAEAARKSMAFKVINNSFFGVVCSPYSRYFDVKLGLAITRTGVTLIKTAQYWVSDVGWKNVYTDTDSIMVKGPHSQEIMRDFVKTFNEGTLPAHAEFWGCRENRFYLDYEKSFSKLCFTADPKTGPNAKKYLYRLSQKGGTAPKPGSEIGWTGIELKRGDSTALAADLLERVVRMIMAEKTPPIEEFEALIEAERLRVMHTKHTKEQLMITKAVSQELEDYTSETVPQVVAAKMLRDRGQEIKPGDKVSWIVCVGSASHPEYQGIQKIMLADDYTGDEADLYYTWESSVFPSTYRVLCGAFPDQIKRFERFAGKQGAGPIRHEKLERAGQLRIGLPGAF
jgi:DNA polymerase elongation subunit (family B)